MPDKEIRLELTAKDEASDAIGEVADAAEDLTDRPAELELDADTTSAERDLEETSDTLERIERQPWIAEVRADIDQAQRQAEELQDQLGSLEADVDTSEVDRKLRDTEGAGIGVTNTFRDMGGPLGEMTGQVGDFGEAFETAGAMAASQFGLSGTATTAMTAGLGAVGLAIGALTFLWGKVRESQEQTKERVDDYKKAIDEANGSLREGARLKLAESLSDDDVQRLADYGLTLDDVVDSMAGNLSPAMADMRDKAAEARDEYTKLQSEMGGAGGGGVGKMPKVIEDWQHLNRLIGDESSALNRAADVHRARQRVLQDQTNATRTYNDQVSESNRRMGVLSDTIAKIPPAKRTDVAVTDNGSAAATGQRIEDEIPDTVEVDVAIRTADAIRQAVRDLTAGLSGAGASVTNVTVHTPRGIGWDRSAARAADRFARRNGGRRVAT